MATTHTLSRTTHPASGGLCNSAKENTMSKQIAKATKATTKATTKPVAKAAPVAPVASPVVAATVPALALKALAANPAKPGTKRHAWLACVLAAKATTELSAVWSRMQAAGEVPAGCGAATMHHVNWAIRAKLVQTSPLGKVA